jgi:Tfp pilus assembly protein PilO
MNVLKRQFTHREYLIYGLTAVVIIAVPMIQKMILPAYDEWRMLRSQVNLQAIDYAKLTANLAIKDSVNQQYNKLDPKILLAATDQIVLSEYLRDIETMARHPSLSLINMKPMPVKEENFYKIYKVKLAIAGKLQEILQFISDVTNSPTVTGLESFSLRGVQGDNLVECNLSFWMIRLTSVLANNTQKMGVSHGK